METVTAVDVLKTMEKYGGAFASHLARAWMCADEGNIHRLHTAFPELWQKYTKMATSIKVVQELEKQDG